MALFRRSSTDAAAHSDPSSTAHPASGGRKGGPTPTRKEAEAARRQRLTQTYSKRESKALAAQHNRAERMRALSARDATPEKALMRDHVDARFSLGEILLPSLVIILAVSFLGSAVPQLYAIGTAAMYLYILAVFVDLFIMWRGFKRVLATRLPRSSPKGLFFYGTNRAIQIRRFRIPRPRVKRGEAY